MLEVPGKGGIRYSRTAIMMILGSHCMVIRHAESA